MTSEPIAPPQNLEAEQGVLGAVLLSDTCLPRLIVEAQLKPDHFYREAHGRIYAAMLKLHDQGEPVDVLTIVDSMERDNEIEHVGGRAAIELLAGSVPAVGNVLSYAKIVREDAQLRQKLNAAYQIQTGVFQSDPELIALGERNLLADLGVDTVWSRDRLADMFWERLESGVAPGYTMPLFDKLRVRKGTVQLWGGHTSHGKTVWVDQVIRHLHEQGARVTLYLNEMTAEERMCRWASATTGISLGRIEDNDLTGEEKGDVAKAMNDIPFEIVECAGWRHDAITRDMRLRKHDVAVLDIVHEIPYRDERDLAGIMQGLTSTSKIADVAIIATVHLNRARTEGAARPRPVMSDIKGASAFEQGADLVGMVWRQDDEITGRPTPDGAIYTLKYRQGRPSGIDVSLDGDYARFERI